MDVLILSANFWASTLFFDTVLSLFMLQWQEPLSHKSQRGAIIKRKHAACKRADEWGATAVLKCFIQSTCKYKLWRYLVPVPGTGTVLDDAACSRKTSQLANQQRLQNLNTGTAAQTDHHPSQSASPPSLIGRCFLSFYWIARAWLKINLERSRKKDAAYRKFWSGDASPQDIRPTQ